MTTEAENKSTLVGFLRRYWAILTIIVGAVWAVASPTAFAIFDVLVYLVAAFAATLGLPLIWRSWFHRRTSDADIESGFYKKAWKELPDSTRVILITVQWTGLILTAAIVVHGFLVWLSGLPVSIAE